MENLCQSIIQRNAFFWVVLSSLATIKFYMSIRWYRADTMWTKWVDRNSGANHLPVYRWYLLIVAGRILQVNPLCMNFYRVVQVGNSAIIIAWVVSLVITISWERWEDTCEITIIKPPSFKLPHVLRLIVRVNVWFLISSSLCTKYCKLNWISKF